MVQMEMTERQGREYLVSLRPERCTQGKDPS